MTGIRMESSSSVTAIGALCPVLLLWTGCVRRFQEMMQTRCTWLVHSLFRNTSLSTNSLFFSLSFSLPLSLSFSLFSSCLIFKELIIFSLLVVFLFQSAWIHTSVYVACYKYQIAGWKVSLLTVLDQTCLFPLTLKLCSLQLLAIYDVFVLYRTLCCIFFCLKSAFFFNDFTALITNI